jgi:ergothioneine biosynthesis protein EgtB
MTQEEALFKKIRHRTEEICAPLQIEDYSAQPVVDVSPPKWHLGHTTWFFETFILKPYLKDYVPFDERFGFLFNSYYNHEGLRVAREARGTMTRPSLEKVKAYRSYVDSGVLQWLQSQPSSDLLKVLQLGLQHEQQHQELLVYDIKYILGNQPLKEAFGIDFTTQAESFPQEWIAVKEGVYDVGYSGDGFCFDNEMPTHKVYIPGFRISKRLLTQGEWLAFMEDGGYENFSLWHEEGWAWIKQHGINSPLYWEKKNDNWFSYSFRGMQEIDPELPVQHISFYEAFAYCEWSGFQLPTEFQWEVASGHIPFGQLWEWTYSAYHPYPGYHKESGALGEYNGKFMINQMVLRGASVATAPGHSRKSYRNFFPASSRWQFAGLRLVKPL